jgi:hypothetical protein
MATIYIAAVSETEIEVIWGGYDPRFGGFHSDAGRTVRPGEELFGLSFEELARRGVGAVEVEGNA